MKQLCFCLQKDNMTADGATDLKIIASPDTVVDQTQSVTLTGAGAGSVHGKTALDFEWKCSKLNSPSHATLLFFKSWFVIVILICTQVISIKQFKSKICT